MTAGDYPVVLLYPTAGGPVVALPDVPAEVDPIEAEGSTLTYIALPPTRGVTPDQQQPLTLVTGTVTVPGG